MPHALMDTLMLKHDVSNRQTWPFWSKWHSPHEHWSLSVRRQSPQVEQSLAPHTWTPRRKGTLNCHLTHKSRWQSGPVPWLEGVGNKPFCPPGKTLMYRHQAEGILGYPAQPTSSVEKESWDGGGGWLIHQGEVTEAVKNSLVAGPFGWMRYSLISQRLWIM